MQLDSIQWLTHTAASVEENCQVSKSLSKMIQTTERVNEVRSVKEAESHPSQVTNRRDHTENTTEEQISERLIVTSHVVWKLFPGFRKPIKMRVVQQRLEDKYKVD